MSEDWRDRMHTEADALRTLRDELRVQLHLAASEARDSWEELERKWHHFEARLGKLGRVSSEAADDVESATTLLLDELKHGYARIRDSL